MINIRKKKSQIGYCDEFVERNQFSLTVGRNTVLQTFLANKVEAESMEESVEDMTAALIAPKKRNIKQ